MKLKKTVLLLILILLITNFVNSQTNYSYPARKSQKVFVFKNQLFLVGGVKNEKASGIIYSNDIWISNFGDMWVNLAKNPLKPRRNKFGCTVFHNKIFIAGGYDEQSVRYLNDVWFSEDGKKWTKSVPNATFQARINPTLLEYKGKLYLIGGNIEADNGDIECLTDIWESKEGSTWTKISDKLPYKSLNEVQFVVFKDKVLAFSGGNGVFSTTDFVNWTLLEKGGPVFEKNFFSVAVFHDSLYLIGGQNLNQTLYYTEFLNEVWKSDDGATWTQICPYPPDDPNIYNSFSIYPARREHASVVFKDRILVTGGVTNNFVDYLDDIWCSADGYKWIKMR